MLKLDLLDIGSKLTIVYGGLNIIFGLSGPILAHLLFPRPFVFLHEDEAYTGVPWSLILATGQQLGMWIVFQADTARGMMIGFGTLTLVIGWKPLRNGEKWALASLFIAGIAAGTPFWVFTTLFALEGLTQGLSGISLGPWLGLLFYSTWALGLLFSLLGIRRLKKT